jgi:hypothetical protein
MKLTAWWNKTRNLQHPIYVGIIESGTEFHSRRHLNSYRRGNIKSYSEELDNLYFPPNAVRMIKPMRMTWTKHVARLRKMLSAHKVSVPKPERKRPLRRLRRFERILLKWILKKLFGRSWTAFM